MTIFTFPLTRVFIAAVAGLTACLPSAADVNAVVEGIALHTHLNKQHPDFEQLGLYPVVKRYNLHEGMAPSEIDVVVELDGQGETTVVLSIEPTVGVTRWQETEGITDLKVLEASKTAFPPVLRLEQEVQLAASERLVFPKVPIKQIVDFYARSHFWPRQLVFRVGVVPVKGETNLKDNVKQVSLTMDPPD